MPRGPNRPHPPVSLMIALQLPQAIRDKNAGRPMNRLLLAEQMDYSPNSSAFRERVSASARYGLTDGHYRSETVSLTQLGNAVTRPRNNHELIEAQRNAVRNVPIYDDLLGHFANAKLPEPDFLRNTLEREPFSIDPAWSRAVAEAFIEDARHVGYLRDIGGSPHIVLDSSATAPNAATVAEASEVDEAPTPEDLTPSENPDVDVVEPSPPEPTHTRPIPMQIFIAHGKNREPLEQLKRILDDWKVPYLVAVDEPNAGRPISEKVADTMRACSAGIFIFTADVDFVDGNKGLVSRPSENVVYELGAASLLYGRKIVILKEAGVSFPTDFSDLGWIEFDKDAIKPVAMDLLREMIALDAVRLVSAVNR